tara:strand:- start:96 stop:305 length:210 start_codon:yes stop_codon:yes gene_type:complete
MNRYQKELCMNLAQLLPENYEILNDIIIEYVELLGNSNRMHDLHEWTAREIESEDILPTRASELMDLLH